MRQPLPAMTALIAFSPSKMPPSAHTASLAGPNTLNAVSEAAEHDSALMERAPTAVARLKRYDGAVVDNVTAAIASDLCATILGYVDKVVQLGDVISQVLLIPSFFNPLSQHAIFRFIHMQSLHGKH